MIHKIFSHFRQNFLTGIFVIIPIAVIAWISRILFNLILKFHRALPIELQVLNPGDQSNTLIIESFLFFVIILSLALFIAALGWGSKLFLGQKILELVKLLLEKIPFLGTVYGALDQLFQTLRAGGEKQFNQVVILEYPRKGIWVIAFVTSSTQGGKLPQGHLNLFVPTVPNPTSGFHLMVPKTDVKDAGLTVEEAFRMILSLGMAQALPRKKP